MTVNLDAYITSNNFFKWKEALYLPSLSTYHDPSPEEIKNIIKLCNRLDKVREEINKPFIISSWLRPQSVTDSFTADKRYQGFNYNKSQKGATASWHIKGLAVDFYIQKMTVDEVMNFLRPKLEEFELSAENNGSEQKRNWVHLDTEKRSGVYRVFNP